MNSLIRMLPATMIAIAFLLPTVDGQSLEKNQPTRAPIAISVQRSSPAYAEVLLRKTEIEAELDSFLVDYTEDYPKIVDARAELGFLKTEIERLLSTKPADAGRLTLALGKLIVRKVEFEVQLDRLLRQYKSEHPDVKRAKKKVDAFEAAIKEILN